MLSGRGWRSYWGRAEGSVLCLKEEMMKAAAVDACNETLRRSSSFNKPSWLLTTLADMEEKMKILAALNMPEDDDEGDTFAERAESYYRKRPQLLALLHDLYNAYISLAHRYSHSHSLSKHHHRSQSSEISSSLRFDINLNHHDGEQQGDGDASDTDDAKSSLSYQQPTPQTSESGGPDASAVIAELVMKQVECDILANEMRVTERMWGELSRKIELQKSLLEVLESERLILLNENARLGYRVGALLEENKGLATESMFIKRKAGELARCVLKMREDQRVCMMSRKIEDLQGQIYKLEKRNKEYYEQLINVKKLESHHQPSPAAAEMKIDEDEEKHQQHQRRRRWLKNQGEAAVNKRVVPAGGGGGGGRVSKWWDRFKNIDLFVCGPHYTSTCDV